MPHEIAQKALAVKALVAAWRPDGVLTAEVDTTASWLSALHQAQAYHCIALGSHAGINDWDATQVSASSPIVPNRKRDLWMNPPLVEAAEVTIPKPLQQKAKKVH